MSSGLPALTPDWPWVGALIGLSVSALYGVWLVRIRLPQQTRRPRLAAGSIIVLVSAAGLIWLLRS